MTLPLKPRLRLDSGALPPPSSFVQATGLDSQPQSAYSHISNFHSLLLDMQLYSSSIKMVKQSMLDDMISYPVFGDHDRVEGKIMLDPTCSQSGRLTVSIEGVFEYISINENLDDEIAQAPQISKHRNIFFSSSLVIPISPIHDPRSAFGVRKRLDHSDSNSPASRSCEFNFELPQGSRLWDKMPPTFTSIPDAKGRGSLSLLEKAEVSYRVTAVWESSDMSENRGILEVPILFHPDTDFQSLDGSKIEPELWLEMPLIPERSIPFHCAVTLPRPRKFSRCSSVPYFVVFTTTPRSSTLTREIAADATIAVSLIRKVTIIPQLPHTPLDAGSDDSDGSSVSFLTPRTKLLKSAPKSGVAPASKISEETISATVKCKPLPDLPQAPFAETRTLKTHVHIGFPKRPRYPRSEAHMPDGLYKGKFHLPKDMLPGVNWAGVSVKYYLDVTVLFRQDAVRACVPIRIL
ncbi:hypothetical protein K503DRAFT_683373 [Rhizopogon vinicolor AM-OR11-026]|uniref:Uncharacterized protein n=1 Tax=Rhizopogon vinicolor AM-OR11-026 TaxID=1314800 RepID=A0A1B7NC15_9AGAM|nr:hypothetical protein K503DRAFT_683373 [Rhizopogon vinicolor AM-OR11-026]